MVCQDGGIGSVLSGTFELKKKLPFYKVQSIGNDFPLIHLEDVCQTDLSALAVRLSDRRTGIGGDGLLAFAAWEQGLKLRMFNPDGSEDFCGNGLRCAAHVAHELGWVKDQFAIDHHGRIVEASIHGKDVRTILGKADTSPDQIPVRFVKDPEITFHRAGIVEWNHKSYQGSALSTGSTHVVLEAGLPSSDEEFRAVSQKLENSPDFPERTSVIWRQVLDENRVKIRIWERGVGETLGCGTGSAATGAELMRERGYGGKIEVVNPGGSVWVEAASWDSELALIGRAEVLYQGQFDLG